MRRPKKLFGGIHRNIRGTENNTSRVCAPEVYLSAAGGEGLVRCALDGLAPFPYP